MEDEQDKDNYPGRNRTRPKQSVPFISSLRVHINADLGSVLNTRKTSSHFVPMTTSEARTTVIPILQQRTRMEEVKRPAPPRTAHQQEVLGLSPAAWLWCSFAHHTLPTWLRDSSLGDTGTVKYWPVSSQGISGWSVLGFWGMEWTGDDGVAHVSEQHAGRTLTNSSIKHLSSAYFIPGTMHSGTGLSKKIWTLPVLVQACYNKLLQTGWLKQQTFISDSSGG